MLSADERRDLLRLARWAIAAATHAAGPAPAPSASGDSSLAGAFVSITIGGQLRGCIGYPEGNRPLANVVEQCAASAAISDPRFPAVRSDEYERLHVEISVLGPIEAVGDISEIEIGRHGLIAELGHRRGLLLPQVAVEWGWAREEFLSHTCLKAGLARDAWREGARLYKFEAEVFGEEQGDMG